MAWQGVSQVFVCLLFLGFFPHAVIGDPGDEHWDRQFSAPGVGTVNMALGFNKGLIYTGGYSLKDHQTASKTPINVYDGTNWSVLAEVTRGQNWNALIYDFAFVSNRFYVGGIFDTVQSVPTSGLAVWDGSSWSNVGGFEGYVTCMATDGTNLYVGGTLTNVAGTVTTNLAMWNGKNWLSVGGGVSHPNADAFGPGVNKLRSYQGKLYIGGWFTQAGSVDATNIACWDGSSWSAVGGGIGGMSDTVHAIEIVGSNIFAGGRFTSASGVSALNIAKWDGHGWSSLGSGLKCPSSTTSWVSDLTALGPDVYVTGNFTNAGGVTAARVAKWNGTQWEAIGALNDVASRAISNSGSVYFAGEFTWNGSCIANHIARFDGANWYPVERKPANGTHLNVFSLGLGSDGLYMGGYFLGAGTTTASRISRWDGTNWYALGKGVTGSYNKSSIGVRAIKTIDANVYVGGAFVSAGDVTANNIALWDGVSWTALGNGVDASVNAIDGDNTGIYVGGTFTNAFNASGPVKVNRVAKWDASNGWSPLGLGVNGSVNTVCVADGLTYVGGKFSLAGETQANNFAVWNGSTWSSVGTGINNGVGGTVNAILVDGAHIYVGGSFTAAGGKEARAIVKWDGNTWSSLGQGMNSTGTLAVRALVKFNGFVYAAGEFNMVDGTINTSCIARWDGTHWETLGRGVGNESYTHDVSALATWGNDLFAGGNFETAGGVESGWIARWNDQIDFSESPSMRLSEPQMLPGNLFRFRATSSPRVPAYVIEYSADSRDWHPLLTNNASTMEMTNSVSGVPVRIYRMRRAQ